MSRTDVGVHAEGWQAETGTQGEGESATDLVKREQGHDGVSGPVLSRAVDAMKVFSSHATSANSPEIGSCGGASQGPKNGPTKALR